MIVFYITLVYLPLLFIAYGIGVRNGAAQFAVSVKSIMAMGQELVKVQQESDK